MERSTNDPLLRKDTTNPATKTSALSIELRSKVVEIKESLKIIEQCQSIPSSKLDGMTAELFNNNSNVVCTKFSENSKYLAVSWSDSSIWIWNLNLHKQEMTIQEAEKSILSFDDNGSQLACRLESGIIKIYEIPSNINTKSFSFVQSLTFFSFLPKNKKNIAFVGKDKFISILNIDNNEVIKNTCYRFSSMLDFEKNGNFLAFVADNSQCVVLRTYDLHEVFKTGAESISFDPFEKNLLLCSQYIGHDYGFATGIYNVWDFKSSKMINSYQFTTDSASSHWFTQSGKLLISHNEQTINIKTGCTEYYYGVSFSSMNHKGTHSAYASGDSINIMNIEKNITEFTIENKNINKYTGYKKDLAFSPDDEFISVTYDNIVKIFNFRSNQMIFNISACDLVYTAKIAFSMDSRFMLINGILIDLIKKVKINIIENPKGVVFNTFSLDSLKLGLVSNTGEVIVWDINESKIIFKYQENNEKIEYYASLSPNMKYLWIGGEKASIINMLNPNDKHSIAEPSKTAVFDKQSRYLCAISNKSLKIINLAQQYQSETLHNNMTALNEWLSIVFSNNSEYVIAHTGKEVLIIEIKTKKCTLKLNSLNSPTSLSLTLDDKFLSIVDYFGNLDIWNIKEFRKIKSLKINPQSSGSTKYTSIYTPNGQKLLNFFDRTLRVLDISCSSSFSMSLFCNDRELFTELDNKELFDGLCDSLSPENSNQNDYKEIYQKNEYDLYLYYRTLSLISSSNYAGIPSECYHFGIGRQKFTPIHFAVFKGQTEFIKTILAKNPNFMIYRDETGRSPVYYSIIGKHQTITDCFLRNFIEFSENAEDFLYNQKFNSIVLDLPYIIVNSSPLLCDFLENCLSCKPDVYFGKRELSIKFISSCFGNFSDFCNQVEVPDSEQEPLKIKISGMKLPSVVGSEASIELLRSILSTSKKDVYYIQIINSFINQRWDEVYYWIYFYSFLMWFNIVFTVLFLCYFGSPYILIFFISFCVTNFLLLFWEVIQLIANKEDYFRDYWNFIDIIKLTASTVWAILYFFQINHTLFDWVIVFLSVIRGLTGFRAFRTTRYYIQLIVQSLDSMKSFLIIFAYTTISFGILNISTGNEDRDLSFESLWIYPFGMAVGNIDRMNSDSFNIKYINFFIAVVLNVILMLNMIISILGDSFDEFQLNSVYYDGKEMTQVLLEVEEIKSLFGNISEYHFMHICCNAYENTNNEWKGKVIDLRSYIKETLDKYNQENQRVLLENNKNLQENNKILHEKIAGLENSLKVLKDELNKNIKSIESSSDSNEKYKTIMNELENRFDSIGKFNSECEKKLEMILEKF